MLMQPNVFLLDCINVYNIKTPNITMGLIEHWHCGEMPSVIG